MMKTSVNGSVPTWRMFWIVIGILAAAFTLGQWWTFRTLNTDRSTNIIRLNTINTYQCDALEKLRVILLKKERKDLRESINFLKANPEGSGIFNEELIKRSIRRERKLITKLDIKSCPVPPTIPG